MTHLVSQAYILQDLLHQGQAALASRSRPDFQHILDVFSHRDMSPPDFDNILHAWAFDAISADDGESFALILQARQPSSLLGLSHESLHSLFSVACEHGSLDILDLMIPDLPYGEMLIMLVQLYEKSSADPVAKSVFDHLLPFKKP